MELRGYFAAVVDWSWLGYLLETSCPPLPKVNLNDLVALLVELQEGLLSTLETATQQIIENRSSIHLSLEGEFLLSPSISGTWFNIAGEINGRSG